MDNDGAGTEAPEDGAEGVGVAPDTAGNREAGGGGGGVRCALLKNDRLVGYCSRSGYCRLTKLRFRMKRELGFIKNNMARCDDTTCL